MRVWTSEHYTLDMGGHALRTDKFFAAAKLLEAEGFALCAPGLPSRETLLRVHAPAWADKVLENRLEPADLERAELPSCPGLARAHLLAVQGTLEACRDALETGLGLHAGGGAHHAFADHGEGYCLLNDLAAGAAWARAQGVERVAVVDLDLHQGNGTASIFAHDASVFTFSMHQADAYPAAKCGSTLDIELEAGTSDAPYLALLGRHLGTALDDWRPGLVIYQAGADPYEKDKLGGLKLSRRGLEARDRLVFEACLERGLPLAVALGGGYAAAPKDTIEIHAATLRSAADCAQKTRLYV